MIEMILMLINDEKEFEKIGILSIYFNHFWECHHEILFRKKLNCGKLIIHLKEFVSGELKDVLNYVPVLSWNIGGKRGKCFQSEGRDNSVCQDWDEKIILNMRDADVPDRILFRICDGSKGKMKRIGKVEVPILCDGCFDISFKKNKRKAKLSMSIQYFSFDPFMDMVMNPPYYFFNWVSNVARKNRLTSPETLLIGACVIQKDYSLFKTFFDETDYYLRFFRGSGLLIRFFHIFHLVAADWLELIFETVSKEMKYLSERLVDIGPHRIKTPEALIDELANLKKLVLLFIESFQENYSACPKLIREIFFHMRKKLEASSENWLENLKFLFYTRLVLPFFAEVPSEIDESYQIRMIVGRIILNIVNKSPASTKNPYMVEFNDLVSEYFDLFDNIILEISTVCDNPNQIKPCDIHFHHELFMSGLDYFILDLESCIPREYIWFEEMKDHYFDLLTIIKEQTTPDPWSFKSVFYC